MIFNTDEKGKKFYFDDDYPERGWVRLRALSPVVLRDITKKTTKSKWIKVKGTPVETQIVNEKLQSELMNDYCITEWSGVCDESGKELECTAENKILLLDNSIRFLSFVADKLAEIAESGFEVGEELEKNLKSTSRKALKSTK